MSTRVGMNTFCEDGGNNGALQNDVTEEQGGQHVHGLVPCLNACGRHILHQRGLPHRAHGVHHPYDNEHQEPLPAGPGVSTLPTISTTAVSRTHRRKTNRRNTMENTTGLTPDSRGGNGRLIGGRRGPRNGQHGANAQDHGTHQQRRGPLPNGEVMPPGCLDG